MALRLSTALRNYMGSGGSLKRAFKGGILEIYSGSQPSSADSAVSGTLLATITDASGSHTNEVRATGSVGLTSGASGSVDTLTVDGISIIENAVSFNTSLTQTASDLADEINASQSTPNYTASASGAVVTIYADYGHGTDANTLAVASTATTIVTSDSNMSGGVDSVNGLNFGAAASGALSKLSSQTWSGVAGATGTAGWFRLKAAVSDSDGADSDYEYLRIDGAIATSGSQLDMNSTSVTSGATQTISSLSLTIPAS